MKGQREIMEEKMAQLAAQLLENNNVLDVFKELESVFEENGLYEELAGCKEKIWHLNGDNLKLKELGKIYREGLNNPDMAYTINMLYIRQTDRELYEELIAGINAKGFKELDTGFDDDCDKFSELWKIADRYCGIAYIIAYLNTRKQYQKIFELLPSLDKMEQIALAYSKEHKEIDVSDMADIDDEKKKLSEKLAINNEEYEINKEAIRLNQKNEQAYANIIEYLIVNKKEDDAIEFYNKKYRKEFNKIDDDGKDKIDKAYNFEDVIWGLSRYYYNIFNYYKSILIEKWGIDYELNEKLSEELKCPNTH